MQHRITEEATQQAEIQQHRFNEELMSQQIQMKIMHEQFQQQYQNVRGQDHSNSEEIRALKFALNQAENESRMQAREDWRFNRVWFPHWTSWKHFRCNDFWHDCG